MGPEAVRVKGTQRKVGSDPGRYLLLVGCCEGYGAGIRSAAQLWTKPSFSFLHFSCLLCHTAPYRNLASAPYPRWPARNHNIPSPPGCSLATNQHRPPLLQIGPNSPHHFPFLGCWLFFQLFVDEGSFLLNILSVSI